MTEGKMNVETVVMKVDNSKTTGKGKPYQRIQTTYDNFWRSNFGDTLEEGDRISCEFEDTEQGYHNMNKAKKIGKLNVPKDKQADVKAEYKPASNIKPRPELAELKDSAREMFGASKEIVSEVLDKEKLEGHDMACVNSVFIFLSKQKYGNGY